MASETQKPEQQQPEKKADKPARKPHSLEAWIMDFEKKNGPIPNKVKDVFRARAISRNDYDAVWQELWR